MQQVPKTWDVLQQVIIKVSKEQYTVITLHGLTIDVKMCVFVFNSVEACAVGEYVMVHKDQQPASFVVLAWQLSMTIAQNSEYLDPSQAAVADRGQDACCQGDPRCYAQCTHRDSSCRIGGGALAPAPHIEAALAAHCQGRLGGRWGEGLYLL